MSRGMRPPDKPRERPTVDAILPLVQAYYRMPGHGVGGSLHIVLDDGNLEDHHVEYCREAALERSDPVGVFIADAMLQMTRTQRNRIYRERGAPLRYDGASQRWKCPVHGEVADSERCGACTTWAQEQVASRSKD